MTSTATRTPIHLDVEPVDYGPDFWRTPHLGTQLRTYSRHQGHQTRFTVLFRGPDGAGREVQDGPITRGVRADLIAQGTMITSTPMPQAPFIDVQLGDLIEIRGEVFQIRDDRPFHDPQLYRVPEGGFTYALMTPEADGARSHLADADTLRPICGQHFGARRWAQQGWVPGITAAGCPTCHQIAPAS
ncbi:hypothetical protein [Pseudonocardia sp. T1-2H]|uniref:hypothetical protein n=1 Tax=Pseudonocardia sp. T1-2H TaxID=3128899 RepID=UPI003100AB2D